MPDNVTSNKENQNTKKTSKRSFFGGYLDEKSKDFLDFRFNTQEEIDKFNEEIETEKEINSIIDKEGNNTEENNTEENNTEENNTEENNTEENNREENNTEENNTEENNTEENNTEENNREENNMDLKKSLNEIQDKVDIGENNHGNKSGDIVKDNSHGAISENNDFINQSNDNFDSEYLGENHDKTKESSKFFDPFELDLENQMDSYGENDEKDEGREIFDPFGLDEEYNLSDNDDKKSTGVEVSDPFGLDEKNNPSDNDDNLSNIDDIFSDNNSTPDIQSIPEEDDIDHIDDIFNDNDSTPNIQSISEEEATESKDSLIKNKDNSVEDNSIEDNSIEDNSIEDNSVEDNSIEDNSVEDNSIEDNSIEDNSIEDNSIEDNSIEDNSIEDNSIEDNSIEDNSVEDNSIEDNSIEDNSIEDNSVEDNSVEDNSIEDNSVEDNSIEDNSIEDNSIEDNSMINEPTDINQDSNNKDITKKQKRNSITGKIITEEEINIEQGQDIPYSEQNEEYQPSDEELFEQEPEFFADDEISQQFFILVKNVRGIFKLKHKNGEFDSYFKIIGGKTNDSTKEYLFYLIEEENEPIDLYIKKIETTNEEEIEHLLQFSYNNKVLDIFVDEIILYESINKSNSDSIEYNDTKTILEKFIFLTETYHKKLKDEISKQNEEKRKKRQLQQIFKGF